MLVVDKTELIYMFFIQLVTVKIIQETKRLTLILLTHEHLVCSLVLTLSNTY